MKISYNWLSDYFEGEVSPEKTSEILTDCGLEVEGYEKAQTVKGGLEGIVIGKVLSKSKHPNADKLSLTKVDVGGEEPLDIVCGAPNVEEGQNVVVAKVGATLYPDESTEEGFKIKKAKIRGEASEGMICAEDEIGLGESHDGIMVLDDEVKPGTPAKSYFDIEEDYVFEIGLTPNRADATSHVGVARDLVTVLNLNAEAKLIKPSVEDFSIDNNDLHIDVDVEDSEACPRYSGLTISGVEVKESPDWLKNKLLILGLTPINNVVDVTNFVLHELGQPLHAFDAAKVEGRKVIVKKLKQDEKFTTLDGVERKLSNEDLMICNASGKGMCIAGVFGGETSGVTENTTSVFLESAYFNPVSVRKTAKRHGLNTDASFRYERGADPDITIYALKRAASLIREITGGKVSSDIVDVYPKPIKGFKIDFKYENCFRLAGQEIDKNLIKNILKDLEIVIDDESGKGLSLTVPPFKVDVTREVDIIEEVMRIYGFNRIEMPEKVSASLSYSHKPDADKMRNIISDLLSNRGFNEMMSNSLTTSSYYKSNLLWPEKQNVTVANPLSSELDVLRQTLLYGGLEAILYNVNRQQKDVRLYEFGKSYENSGEYKEQALLSLFLSGRQEPEFWNTDDKEQDIYNLKGYLNAVFGKLGLEYEVEDLDKKYEEIFEYGIQLKCGGGNCGISGKLTGALLEKFDLEQDVYFAELQWDILLKLSTEKNEIRYQPVPKFPAVRRDLALLLDKEVKFKELKELARQAEQNLLKEVSLFDVYQGKNIDENKKSYALSFVFRHENKTLRDKQVEKIMDKLIKAFKKELGAEIR